HPRHSVYNRQGDGPQHAYKKKFPYKNLAGFVNNKLSDKIIATSPAAKISLVEMGTNQRKTVMIYNAIDGLRQLSREEKNANRHKWGIKDEDFVCAMIARFEKVKGHEFVLKAAQMVQAENVPVKFLFVGVGSEEANLKKMAQNLELDNVIFTGFVKDVEEVLGISHVQINASFSETTNLALLEGLSLGVPAIATDVGGNPFVVNDGVNGVLFESKDYAALYKAIIELRNSPAEYAHYSKRSKEIFNERFTAPVMTKKVEDVYNNLLGVKAPEETEVE
ncbi:MAG: glycosyltransferase family 4 protein, partial [Defluviitaleaceae bacterium]|nr:glycosyltransferase family 4 protein [Defluviitaleaceae bacterium]